MIYSRVFIFALASIIFAFADTIEARPCAQVPANYAFSAATLKCPSEYRGVVPRGTIRAAGRVFRCEIHTGSHRNPNVLWLV
jgi:hypothetical protein